MLFGAVTLSRMFTAVGGSGLSGTSGWQVTTEYDGHVRDSHSAVLKRHSWVVRVVCYQVRSYIGQVMQDV